MSAAAALLWYEAFFERMATDSLLTVCRPGWRSSDLGEDAMPVAAITALFVSLPSLARYVFPPPE